MGCVREVDRQALALVGATMDERMRGGGGGEHDQPDGGEHVAA